MNRARSRDEGGYVFALSALLMTALLVIASIAIDLGNARQQKQKAQGIADAAALSGAQGLRDIPTPNPYVQAFTVAWKSLSLTPPIAAQLTPCGMNCKAHTTDGITMEVTTPWDGNVSYVHVLLCWPVATSLGAVINRPSVTVCSAATAENIVPAGAVGFWLGSYAARIAPLCTTGTCLAGNVLGGLAGQSGPLALTAAGYSGLVGTNVSLATLAVDGGFATPDELLAAKVSNSGVALAIVKALQDNGYIVSVANQNAILLALQGGGQFTVGQYLKFAQGTNGNAGSVVINMADFLFGSVAGSAYLSNGSNAINIPSAGLNVLGLAGAQLSMRLVEPPRHYTGPVGGPTCPAAVAPATSANVCTIQVTGTLTGTIGGLTVPVPFLGNQPLGVTVSMPIGGGSGSGLLTSVDCLAHRFTVQATTAGLKIPATISLSLLGIPLAVSASVTQLGNQRILTFTEPFPGPTQNVSNLSTPAIALSFTNLPGIFNGLASSILNVLSPAVTTVLNNAISSLAPVMGLSPGGADVWADPVGPICPNSILSLNQ